MNNLNQLGYQSVETENIRAIFSKDELMSMFEVAEDSTRELTEYDLSNTVLITISDPWYEYIPEERMPVEDKYCEKFNDYIKVQFWDVASSDENYQIIDLETVKKMTDFIKKHKDKKFIINCNAGISRSAGSGLVVEYILGEYKSLYEFKTGFNDVITGHFRYAPNLSVLDQYIKLLENEGL